MSLFSRLFKTKSLGDNVFSEPILNTSTLWWHSHGDYGAIYRKQPAVRTVVDFLANNIAQLSLKTYERVGNNDRVQLDDHELAELLRFPNPDATAYRHMRDTVADREIFDRAYWRKIRVGRVPRSVVRIPPPLLSIEVDLKTLQRTYRIGSTGEVVPRSDLVIFPGYHPDGSEDGVSPLETLRRVLAEEWAAQNHRENFWKNAARQSGVIERPVDAPEWGDIARERFRKDWQSTMAGGSNAGKTGILEEGMKWNPAAFSPKESEYIEGRKLTTREVARVYAPSLPGLMSDEAKADIEAYHRQLYQDVLAPRTRSLEDEIELQLLPEFEVNPRRRGRVYVEFNLQEKLRGSFEEQARSLVTAVGTQYVAVNEARSMLNMRRIDDEAFDVPSKPMNVMFGGQPAVTVPTEDPGTRIRSSKPKVKAVPRGPQRRRDQAAEVFTALFADYFTRQERAVVSALGAKALADDLRSRWDADLLKKLERKSQELVSQTGRAAAQQIQGVFNPALTLAFVETRSKNAALSINQSIFDDVEEAFDDAGLDGARSVFEEAKTSRAERLGLGTVTGLISFARADAAKQSQAADGRIRNKTWVVTSGNSRHPEMNGEMVPVFESFSNGMQYPGDGAGGADATAGCKCLLFLA